MIVYCTALANAEARELLVGYERKGRPPVEGHGNVAWLGIEPIPSPLRRWPQEKQLVLDVPDQTAHRDLPANWTPGMRERHRADDVPTIEHAQQIATFAHWLHDDARPWALLVHCTAGVSRSTAVATWVRERFDVTQPESSSHWRPNATLLRLLREIPR